MVNMYNVFSWQRVAANLHENECHEEKLVIYKPSTMSKKSGRGLERTAVDVQDSEQMCQGGKLKEAPGQRCVWQRGQKWYGKPSWWPIPKYHWTFLLSSFVIHIWSYLPDFPAISPAPPRPVALCGPNSMCVLLRWWRRRVYPYGVSQFSGSAVFQIDYPIGSMVLLYMVTFCNIYHQYTPFVLAYIPDPMGMKLVGGWWKPLKLRCWSTWLDVDITALKLIVSWSCLNHFPLII